MKNTCRPRSGSLPSSTNSAMPITTVIGEREQRRGERHRLEGCGRTSSLSMAASCRSSRQAGRGCPAATARSSIRRSARPSPAPCRRSGESGPCAITTSRSLISNSSSSSSLTTSTAQPASRSASSSPRICAAAPTSTPQVGCETMSSFGLGVDLAADDELLQVAARQRLRRRVGPAGLDVEARGSASSASRSTRSRAIQPRAPTRPRCA